jgi:hypothetical protein
MTRSQTCCNCIHYLPGRLSPTTGKQTSPRCDLTRSNVHQLMSPCTFFKLQYTDDEEVHHATHAKRNDASPN